MTGARPGAPVRLYLLRHGEVLSHRGDVPITEGAAERSREVGAAIGREDSGTTFTVLSGETRRATETADHVAQGIRSEGGAVAGPDVAFALRNPDLYLAGVRVDMVSSHEALAAQVDGLDVDEVGGLEFFPEFIAVEDRVGWWLRHENPPGDDARTVAARMRSFARSLGNPHRSDRGVIVAVTHSPILRAVGLDALGRDIGEPDWVSGFVIDVDESGSLTTSLFSP